MLSQWLMPVDPVEVIVADIEERSKQLSTDALKDAVTDYGMRYFSEPCLSTARQLLTVGECLDNRGVPEYLTRMRGLITVSSLNRCNKECCKVIHHSASNAN